MKSKLFVFVFLASLLSQTYAAQGADCDMGNEIYCPIDLQKTAIQVNVHNSGNPGRCGIKIVSNQNFIFSRLNDFIAGLEATVGSHSKTVSMDIQNVGNSIFLTDTSVSPDGDLPSLFIAEIKIKTKDGKPLSDLVEATIGSGSPLNGDTSLIILPVMCEKN